MSKMSKQIEMIKKEDFLSPNQLENNLPKNQTHLSAREIQRMMQLEGDCKILKAQYIQFDFLKALVLGFLVTISLIGLLFVKHFKRLRVVLFYKSLQKNQKQKATHIYVQGTDKNDQICIILRKQIKERKTRVFQFKHLQYIILENEEIPLAFAYEKHINQIISQQFIKKGLTQSQAEERELQYGLNQHKVQVPGYFEYLFESMTGPFFIFQYIVSTIYILENVALFGIFMIIFSWLTTSINYILLRRSYNKIKQTAEKEFPVKVFRNGDFKVIKNTQLVPGDLYEPKDEIPCDSILVRGDMFTNEASLTGQDVPVAKVRLTQAHKTQESCHWIYQGSIIETVKQNTLAVVINVGFGTRRGRIIRKILTKSPKQPQFFKRLIYFLIQVLIISLIVYFATLKYLLGTEIQPIMVFFRFLDFITYSFPAPFPIYFNLAYSFCLVRLHRQEIIGVEAQKTIQGGRMKTICFDKTGTLTQKNKIKLDRIYHIPDKEQIMNITNTFADHYIISGLFGCCNSVQMINSQAKGDEIDLQMFLYSKSQIKMIQTQDILRSVLINGQKYDILRINQYESRFQSMSVLVHHQNKYYIYVKGSPEMIHKVSSLKNSRFDRLIKDMSLQGFRSIAFGYKQVNKEEVSMIMKMDRSEYMKDITILGLVSFVNLLKDDAKQTIETLTANEINTKIITGDNIYLGVQTAILVGMIPPSASIVILQGNTLEKDQLVVKTLTRKSEEVFDQKIETIKNFQYKNQPNLYYAIDNAYVQNHKAFLHDKVKVFARISPQNKALIVKNHKEIYKQQIKQRPLWDRHFGQCGLKVGMVGDGANDLIAIKQADVGIGIADADAVYSASFAIKNLSQICQIIREAKNTQRQVIDIAQYFGMVSLMYMIQAIILTKDGSTLSSMEYIYSSFVNSLFITLLFGVSRASETMTKYLTNINFMALENHLVFWGNMTIFTLGMVSSYLYYSNSADFIANPTPAVTFANGANSLTKSATIVFLCQNIVNIFLPVFIYRSEPWKQKFYKNKAFTILILVNIVLILTIFFTTGSWSWIDLQKIAIKEAGIVLLIMLGFVVIGFAYNRVIDLMVFHEKNYYKYYAESKLRGKQDLVKAQHLSQ